MTVKTVETHLSRIYAKLGVRSRAELAHRFASEKIGEEAGKHYFFAITGGTGKYSGARGEVMVEEVSGEKARLTFRIASAPGSVS